MSIARVLSILALLLLPLVRPSAGEYTKQCYTPPRMHLYDTPYLLPDISRDLYPDPTPGRALFFHETSCNANLTLSARQACAVESAARHNPRRKVFVLFAAPRPTNGTEDKYVKVLSALGNVRLLNANLWDYARGTLAEKWLMSNDLFQPHRLPLMGDFLRILTLNKFQGVFLDLDTISLRELQFNSNYAVPVSTDYMGAGLISLANSRAGRILSEYFLRDFLRSVQQGGGTTTAQATLTRVVKGLCKVQRFVTVANNTCMDFTVLPLKTAYVVSPWKFNALFNVSQAQEVLGRVEQSTIVHTWSRFSASVNVTKGSGSAFDVLAKTHCPGVYGATKKMF